MSNGWPLVPLGEILTKSEQWTELDPNTEYRQVTVRLWGKGVVERATVRGAEIAADRQIVVQSGQFILSRIDARNGAFGLVPEALDGAVVSNDFPAFKLNCARILPTFLEWMSKTQGFVDLCKAASEGTTNRVRLKEERFLAMTIPLPPLAEQQRIVARIEALAARIAEARGLRQAAVEEVVTLNYTAIRALFKGRLEGNGVTHRALGSLVKVVGGGTPSKHNPTFWDGDIPWVSPKDMKVPDLTDTEDHISEAALNASAANLIPENSVLVVVRSGILRRTIPVAINRIAVTVNQDMKALVPVDDISPEFLRWWFRVAEHKLLESVKGGTTVQSLMWDKVIDQKVPVPPLPEQRRIVAYLDDLQARVDALQALQAATAAELDALLPAVLDKAFRGEL